MKSIAFRVGLLALAVSAFSACNIFEGTQNDGGTTVTELPDGGYVITFPDGGSVVVTTNDGGTPDGGFPVDGGIDLDGGTPILPCNGDGDCDGGLCGPVPEFCIVGGPCGPVCTPEPPDAGCEPRACPLDGSRFDVTTCTCAPLPRPCAVTDVDGGCTPIVAQ